MSLIIPRRFSGTAHLYGDEGYSRLQDSRVCIVGVGGVGSWAAEAIVRAGVGNLVLIDLDHVAESNINRQIQALDGTVGAAKVQVLKERFQLINPDCQVSVIEEFVSVDNVAELLQPEFNFVLDCIDAHRIKAAVISHCRRNKISAVTAGSAGGKMDASRVRINDLKQTEQDPLLAKTRRLLRKQYGYSSNLKRRFEIAAVWSDEPVSRRDSCEVGQGTTGLNCAGLGSSMAVTATFGLVAAGHAVKKLAQA
ncbi:MAG: tRNA threonylcarbamoyladenosine dehydratase [bacterium]